ncbi:MAG: replicative DNA helicase, partial [Flavobacteriia bacterium]|nr:replicative DNA helicase [Flavobacteriia bacterium]
EEHTSSTGQAELIVAKHRNGGLDNIRMKFIGHLGKFEDLQSDDTTYEFQSKMNPNDPGNTPPDKFGTPGDSFDLPNNEDEDEVPF